MLSVSATCSQLLYSTPVTTSGGLLVRPLPRPNADRLILPNSTQFHTSTSQLTYNMSTTATSTTTSPTLQLRGESSVQNSPATSGFPITTDLKSSPFHEIQTGPSRTVLPTFGSLEEERVYRKEHLALVFRIIHRFKLAEGINGMILHLQELMIRTL